MLVGKKRFPKDWQSGEKVDSCLKTNSENSSSWRVFKGQREHNLASSYFVIEKFSSLSRFVLELV